MRVSCWLLLTSVGLLCATACSNNNKTASPDVAADDEVYQDDDYYGTFLYMVDNAMQSNMTVTDNYFVPHTATLNGLGEHRLARMSALLRKHGGVLHYNTDVEDEELVFARMDAVVDYLREAGVDTTRETIREGLPRTTRVSAGEAILIHQTIGTFDPDQASAATALPPR